MIWTIYGYRVKETKKVCYIGQTNNIQQRRYKHEKYDPYTISVVEYEYPLSRGIRKHGEDYYEFFIIESGIEDAQEAIDREAYWIAYYDTYNNGYNQTPGGKAPKYIKFKQETIELAKNMMKNNIPFKKIQEETGISMPHLSEINTGKRHHDDKENYPLCKMTRGRKLDDEAVEKITDLLRNTKISMDEIGKLFEVSQGAITGINTGKAHKRNIDYPIRKNKPVSTIPSVGE